MHSRDIINDMLREIQLHKRDRENLLNIYICERLNKQIKSYYDDIIDSYSLLTHQKNEIKLAKKLYENAKFGGKNELYHK